MMKKCIQMWVIFLIVVTLLGGCTPETAGDPPSGPEQTPTVSASLLPETGSPEPTVSAEPEPPDDPIADQLAGLTTEQKVGQLLVAGVEGYEPGEDARAAVQESQVGGIILFGRNVTSAGQLAGLTNGLKALNGSYVPLFLCVDQEGGRVDRMPTEVDRTPSAQEVGTGGVKAAEAYGALLAAECAAFGLNMDFAPSLDIWSNPENTVIGDRAFNDDWEEVSMSGFFAVQALRASGNVIPVVKHFPGHGDTVVDSHYGLPVVEKTVDELRNCELPPFDMVLSGKFWSEPLMEPAPAVMVAHILMTAIDPERPASLSHAVVTGLLREKLGFDGVVCTDDLTMAAVSDTYGMGEAAVLALEAGCDLLLVCHGADNLTAARDALLEAVETGRISQERLDESVYRILKVKSDFALTNDPVDENVDVSALNDQIAALKGLLNG